MSGTSEGTRTDMKSESPARNKYQPAFSSATTITAAPPAPATPTISSYTHTNQSIVSPALATTQFPPSSSRQPTIPPRQKRNHQKKTASSTPIKTKIQ